MKQTLLYIVPHDFYPAQNGGQLRVFHILKALIQRFEVTVVFGSEPNEYEDNIEKLLPGATYYSIGKDACKVTLPERLKARLISGSYRNLDLFTVGFYKLTKERLRHINFDFIFFEHMESLYATKSICKLFWPKSYRIINLHNVDHEVWLAEYKLKPSMKQLKLYSEIAYKREKNLHKYVHKALVCSSVDKVKVESLNKNRLKTVIVPNGTAMPIIPVNDIKKKDRLLFVGSLDYFPNIAGLRWFYENVWQLIVLERPNCSLYIVGKGNISNLNFINHNRIHIIGQVASVSEHYFESQISIVPLLHGSGTRLKIPEAMAHGTVVISTSKGAEGNNYEDGIHLLIADTPNDFAQRTIELLNNPELCKLLEKNAYELVNEQFDWLKITEKMVSEIKAI